MQHHTPLKKPIIGIINFSVLIKRNSGSWFSSREQDWDKHVEAMLNPERLHFRTRLFLDGVLRQFDQQTMPLDASWFNLTVVISTLLPVQIKEQLYHACLKRNWLNITERSPDDWIGAEKIISDHIASHESPHSESLFEFLSFRLDDDDLISNDFAEKCQPYITPDNIGKILTFENGNKLLWDIDKIAVCNIAPVTKPFIAIGLGAICQARTTSGEITSNPKSVFVGGNHFDLHSRFPTIIDKSPNMFLWSHHKTQDTHGKFRSDAFSGAWTNRPSNDDLTEITSKFPTLQSFL